MLSSIHAGSMALAIDETCPGIYRIVNDVSGSFYVGSSINLRRRMKEHVTALVRAKHNNQPLQRAWKKYGANALRAEILEIVEDRRALVAREQYWIDTLKPTYNAAPTAGNTLGYRFTKRQRRKLSDAQRLWFAFNADRIVERSRQWGLKQKGAIRDPETRARRVEAGLKRWQNLGPLQKYAFAERSRLQAVRFFSSAEYVAKRLEVAETVLAARAAGLTVNQIRDTFKIGSHTVAKVVRNCTPESAGRHNGRPSKSGIRGITWNEKNSKWTVFVYPGETKSLYLGSFSVLEDAAARRDAYMAGDTERHVRKCLSEEAVREMRAKYAAGVRQRDLAIEYGLKGGQVSLIVNLKTFKDVI